MRTFPQDGITATGIPSIRLREEHEEEDLHATKQFLNIIVYYNYDVCTALSNRNDQFPHKILSLAHRKVMSDFIRNYEMNKTPKTPEEAVEEILSGKIER